MNAVTSLLVIVLSGQGYWFEGQQGTVNVSWAVEQEMPEAELVWQLRVGEAVLSSGTMPMRKDDASVRIEAPAVRVRTVVYWICEVRSVGDGTVLASGAAPIHVFPDDLLDGVTRRMDGRRLFVIDPADRLTPVLERAGIRHERVTDAALRLQQADLVLVAADALEASPFPQAPLLAQVGGGASIFLFAQHRPERLADYPLRRRAATGVKWRDNHGLFNGFERLDLEAWIGQQELVAIQLPADEPALELAWWQHAVGGKEPAAIEALVVTRRSGDGRIVLWQVPLSPFESDPRSQMLLRNAIDYLLSPPEPTPRPSERREAKTPEPVVVPTTRISPGVQQ